MSFITSAPSNANGGNLGLLSKILIDNTHHFQGKNIIQMEHRPDNQQRKIIKVGGTVSKNTGNGRTSLTKLVSNPALSQRKGSL